MLVHLSNNKVNQICNLAAKQRTAEGEDYEIVNIGSNESDDLVDEILYGETDTLDKIIHSLTSNELTELLALMWFGKGEFGRDPSIFPQLLENAQQMAKDKKASYISGKNKLEKYLRVGLQYLGES